MVTMRRAASRRRKAEAIQAQLEKIKPLSKAPAPVPAAALAQYFLVNARDFNRVTTAQHPEPDSSDQLD